MEISKEVVVIGAGPAGLAAAVALKKKGVKDILVLEREDTSGGILRQCIHDGFGLTRFGESISGPEYAYRFLKEAEALNIEILTEATVISISEQKRITVSSAKELFEIQAKAVVLAMGCRERTRGALAIPGERPSGVYTAGMAQNYINLCNLMVGKEIIILGSGDIGLIMARRLTLEGAHVIGVFEVLPYPSGLARNVTQCLDDYEIPLYLSQTVTEIHGRARLEGVTVSCADENRKPVPGTERRIACDTLILSVGLIPENELSIGAGVKLDTRTGAAVIDEFYETSVEGIFAAGNVLHVHDLVDQVSLEAERLAEGVFFYLGQKRKEKADVNVIPQKGIRYAVPQHISGKKDFILSFRVDKPFEDREVVLVQNGHIIMKQKRKKAVPAEMIQIKVSGEKIQEHGEIEVLIQ